MRQRNLALSAQIEDKLITFSEQRRVLPGIKAPGNRTSLLEQMVESIRRIEYVKMLLVYEHSPLRADPTSGLFDPLKAAVLAHRQGNDDEAFWLVFLFVHFGKHRTAGWRMARDIYGRLGQQPFWSWNAISANPHAFKDWLAQNYESLRNDGVPRHFGNHRKYETLDPNSRNGTGVVVESYINWVGPLRSHAQLIGNSKAIVGDNPKRLFDYLYQSLCQVRRFGRTARFDYLAMIGNLGFAPITPGLAYLHAATGPLSGAKLLFGGSTTVAMSASQLEAMLAELDEDLGVGMQVLEDALCNWQKSPGVFRRFRG